MTERRIDPFTARGVLIAPQRRGIGAARTGGLPAIAARCPFCPGHEADTEETVARWPSSGEWQVRVVRNRYPVVDPSFANAGGIHEVGIDAAAHDVDLAELSPDHLSAMLRLYRDRVRALERERSIAAVLFFRNRGRRAGSSQPHPHSQIAGLRWVPTEVALRAEVARAHFEAHGESVHTRVLREERADGRRMVLDDRHAALLCPYAPTRPFELRVMPDESQGSIGDASDSVVDAVARLLGEATRRLRDRTSVTDFNLVVRQPPVERGAGSGWHVEILPRTGGDAGFELAGGEMIVVVSPEEAAARLR